MSCVYLLSSCSIRLALGLIVSGLGFYSNGAENGRTLEDDDRTRLVQSLPAGFFTPVTAPSRPIAIQQLCPEWEPSSTVLMSVPLSGTLANPKALKFVLDFLIATVPHIPVGILYNRDEESRLGRLIHEIEKNPSLSGYSGRIDFIESRVQGFWIRDHGPQFGRSSQGDLIVIDSIFRFLEVDSLYDPSRIGEFNAATQRNYSDDLTPQFVANYLRSDYEYETSIVRPPLHLQGGDFSTDGRGNVFISEDTVASNGGDWGTIEQVFQDYFGAESIHILNPPKGNSAKHLDLLFKVATDKTYFVSRQPKADYLSTSHSRNLAQQISRSLRNNLSYIKRNLPGIEVLELPMPSLLVKSRAERLLELRGEVLNLVSRKANVDLGLVLNGNPKLPEVESARNAVALEMLVETGKNINLNKDADLEIVAQNYLGLGIEGFLETYVNRQAIYRSYTNSLIVTNPSLKTLILLPRFQAQEGESQSDYDAMEQEVERAYLSLYPSAQLQWIDSDEITRLGGSIHCISISVPLQVKLTASRKLKKPESTLPTNNG